MRTLIALLYFVMTLVGCHDSGGTRYESRVSVAGHDQVYGKARAENGKTRFECLQSDSGACHFTLYALDCPTLLDGYGATPGACRDTALAEVAVPAGTVREATIGVDEYRLCLSADAAPRAPDCQPKATPLAAR